MRSTPLLALAALWTALTAASLFGAQCDGGAPTPAAPPSPPSLSSLAQMARAQAGSERQLSEADLAAAKAQVEQAMAQIDQRLARTAPENAEAWRNFLHWDAVKKALAEEKPARDLLKTPKEGEDEERSNLDLRENKALESLAADEKGLELPEFQALRGGLRRYADVLRMLQAKVSVKDYLVYLADSLDDFVKSPTPELAADISAALYDLTVMGEAREIVQGVLANLNHPNLYLDASERLVVAGIEDDNLREPVEVHECIIGTDVYGRGYSVGKLSANLIPNPHAAVIDLQFKGVSYTNNVGYNGPVTIYSHGATEILSRNAVRLTDKGFETLKPEAWAQSHTTIDAVCANCWLIQRFAERQAMKRLPEAEAESSQRGAERAAERMNQRTREQMVESNKNYQERFVDRLNRRDAYPTRLNYFTTSETLGVVALHANNQQVSEAAYPPAPSSHDLSLRIHESYVRNFFSDSLYGRVLSDKSSGGLPRLGENFEDENEVKNNNEDKEPRSWNMWLKPNGVTARFDQNHVTLSLHIEEMQVMEKQEGEDDQEGAEPPKVQFPLYDIVARRDYLIVPGPNGTPQLVRTGDVIVEHPESESDPPQDVVRRGIVANSFRKQFFFDRLTIVEEIKLRDRYEKAGPLQLREATSDGGWLTLGYAMPDK